jgi:group I intron endonuclease
MEKQYCVYCHISPSGKRYIGVTCRKPEKRWNYGRGYTENTYFTRAIEKYGWNSFEHIILYEGLTRQEASRREKELIAKYDTTNRSNGYNLESGGLYGDKSLSDETKRKIGDAHRGKYTEAQREATKHRRNPNYHHSDEIKKRIGDSHRGKHLSEEQKRHLSEINKGKKMSPEHIEKLRQLRIRRVAQYDLDGNKLGEYESLKEAADANDTWYQSIRACCIGKVRSAAGFVWRFAE